MLKDPKSTWKTAIKMMQRTCHKNETVISCLFLLTTSTCGSVLIKIKEKRQRSTWVEGPALPCSNLQFFDWRLHMLANYRSTAWGVQFGWGRMTWLGSLKITKRKGGGADLNGYSTRRTFYNRKVRYVRALTGQFSTHCYCPKQWIWFALFKYCIVQCIMKLLYKMAKKAEKEPS